MYEVVIKSVSTGGICRVIAGFETFEAAQTYVSLARKSENRDFWYEIRKM